jgi:hypothetical protein
MSNDTGTCVSLRFVLKVVMFAKKGVFGLVMAPIVNAQAQGREVNP